MRRFRLDLPNVQPASLAAPAPVMKDEHAVVIQLAVAVYDEAKMLVGVAQYPRAF